MYYTKKDTNNVVLSPDEDLTIDSKKMTTEAKEALKWKNKLRIWCGFSGVKSSPLNSV